MVFRPFQTEVNADDNLLHQIYLVYYKYHIGIIQQGNQYFELNIKCEQ